MKKMLVLALALPLLGSICPGDNDLEGTWDLESTAIGSLTATLELNKDGDGTYADLKDLIAMTGNLYRCATGTVDGNLDGDRVTLRFTCQHLTTTIEGKLEGNSVTNSRGEHGWPLTMTRR